MIKVEITTAMKQRATRNANATGRLYNSITRGKGNAIGYLGEEIACAVLGGTKQNNSKQYNIDYDLLLDNGVTIEVKTKRTSVEPKDYYECSVAATNTEQKCDYYCFVRVHDSRTSGWFLGVIPKKKFYKNAKFMKKGTLDPDNGFVVKADCYNLPISKLEKGIKNGKQKK